jgi:hypothetical protein
MEGPLTEEMAQSLPRQFTNLGLTQEGWRFLQRSETAQEILAYLAAHPEAQDTLEGIVQWWLLEQKIRRQTARVKEALAELVTQKLILERPGSDLRKHYRLNRRKMKTIRAILAQGGNRPLSPQEREENPPEEVEGQPPFPKQE